MSAKARKQDQLFEGIELDAITEMLNIGIGAAAASLSEMVDEEVTLSVPNVSFLTRHDAARTMANTISNNVSGVEQHFNGPFSGDALLLFEEDKSLELVRAVLKDSVSSDSLSDMEQEAMTEIGNIILNACLATLANIFDIQITGDLPQFLRNSVHQVFNPQKADFDSTDTVLFLKMGFAINNKDIEGYVTFIMDINSTKVLKENVDRYMGILS